MSEVNLSRNWIEQRRQQWKSEVCESSGPWFGYKTAGIASSTSIMNSSEEVESRAKRNKYYGE